MTEPLFWKNPYIKEFEATIIGVKKEGVVLDQTLFYPGGGGQASDRGILKNGALTFKVDNVYKQENEIVHHIALDFQDQLKEGDIITGKIDWEYRYGLMKAHSSQHIFSAVILKDYNIETAQIYLGFEDVTIKFAQEINYELLKPALQEINDICISDTRKILTNTFSYEEAKKLTHNIRGEIPNEDPVRLVQVENCDTVCCGGIHLQNSTEIGPLYIYEFKRGNEIKYYLGNKASKLLSESNIDVLNIAKLLEQPVTKIKEVIERRSNLISNLQVKNMNFALKILEIMSQNALATINDVAVNILNLEIDNKILKKQFKNFPSNSLLVIITEDKRVIILSNSQYVIANNLLDYLVKKYGGKGGGSKLSAQGSFETKPKDLLLALKSFLAHN